MGDVGWTGVELSEVEFGDERLNKRFLSMAKKIDEKPEASIPEVFESWGDTKAAYRFFDNERVTPSAMLYPHAQQTVRRVQEKETVLVIQDTSFFTYGHHKKTKGLGKFTGTTKTYGRKFENTGIIMHTAYAIDTMGVPLGILDQELFVRSPDNISRSTVPDFVRKMLPIELKESVKWINPIQHISLLFPASSTIKLVHVCDREGDFFDLFWTATDYEVSILVRAGHDRVIGKPTRSKKTVNERLFERAKSQPELGYLEVEVQGNDKRKDRTARVAIRSGTFELFPSRHHPAATCDPPRRLSLYFVYVTEIEPPPGQEALEWLLITDLPSETLESAVEKVKWYQKRFRIETFHKILKSGFRVQECRIATANRLKKYLTFMSILSWRIHWMTWISRTEPSMSAREILNSDEIDVLQSHFTKGQSVRGSPLTVAQALKQIAQLGGFLNRKSDGEPGPIVIWRGWTRLSDMTLGWKLNHSERTCG